MPEKKFVISPGKRIFSRVEQECETGVQGWNGTVPKGGAKTGGASVGAGGKRQGEETGLQRGKGSRGEELTPKESLSTAARNERMRPVGPRREERTRPEPKKGRPFGEAAGLSRAGAAEKCRRGARRLRADSCPRRKHCVRTRAAPQGQERLAFSFSIGKPGPLARAEILEWRTGRHNAKAAPQGQGGEA